MSIPYRSVIAEPGLRTRFTDTAMITEYLDAGSPAGELIYLGFGETWTRIAPGLVDALAKLPQHAHGYVISQYGLPRLRQVLRDYLTLTHRLPTWARVGRDYEVAVTDSGTRGAMFDFGRLLGRYGPRRHPVVVAPMPGWDYAGVFEPLGYRMRYLPIRVHDGTLPQPDDLDAVIGGIAPDEYLALVVINAQHNPTGMNWPASTVRELVRRALSADAAILLDDAYYGVHHPAQVPTSALRVLLEELPAVTPHPWLAVRSLGKQFGCNGWGIGAATAHPEVLDVLVNEVSFQRGFAGAIPLQEAMAEWLTDPAAQLHLDHVGGEYSVKRAEVKKVLIGALGYPPGKLGLGDFAPYARVPVPEPARTVAEFQRECLGATGVLVGVDRWSGAPSAEQTDEPACIRLFLGPPLPVIMDGLGRLADAGYRYPGR